MDDRMKREIEEAVIRALSANMDNKRFLDVSRIPLICQSIVGIDEKLDKLVTQEQFWPVKVLVYGLTGIILTSVIASLVMQIIK